MNEDLNLILKNPGLLIETLKEGRQKLKFYTHLNEIFVNQYYYWLYSQAKPHTTLLDIGAFIGDTAIYFAMNPNIDRIIAYEPSPNTFKILQKNIAALPEGLRKKIEIKNIAILQEGEGYINSTDAVTGTNNVLRIVAGTPTLQATSLKEEIKELKNVMIKCDTEGAEYQIFKNKGNLQNVYAIQMEYHKGVQNLSNLFQSAGMKVEVQEGEDGLGCLKGWR